jgi:hypothetical protein
MKRLSDFTRPSGIATIRLRMRRKMSNLGIKIPDSAWKQRAKMDKRNKL